MEKAQNLKSFLEAHVFERAKLAPKATAANDIRGRLVENLLKLLNEAYVSIENTVYLRAQIEIKILSVMTGHLDLAAATARLEERISRVILENRFKAKRTIKNPKVTQPQTPYDSSVGTGQTTPLH